MWSGACSPCCFLLDLAEEEAAATLEGQGHDISQGDASYDHAGDLDRGQTLVGRRAFGEFGSVVMVAGNRPMSTKTAPLYIFGEIESGHQNEAMAISVVLLAASLAVLFALNWLQRHGRNEQYGH